MPRSLLTALAIALLSWQVVWAQVPPNISRNDSGDYIDKLVTLLAYLRSNGQLTVSVNTGTVAVSNTSAETVLYSVTIPANTLSINTALRVHLHGFLKNQTAGPADYTLRTKYGGIVTSTLQFAAVASATGAYMFVLQGEILGSATAGPGKQACWFELSRGGAATHVSTLVTSAGDSRRNSCDTTVPGADMTVDQLLQITVQMSTADVNASVSKESAYVTRLP